MNKQNLYCFLLILLCSIGQNPCAAQQYFNKRYTIGCGANIFTCALQKNNRYYVITDGCVDSVNYIGGTSFLNKAGIKFCVMDSAGNVITTKLYQRDDKIYTSAVPAFIAPSNNLIALNDGTFLHAFTVVDTAVAPYNPSYQNFQIGIVQFDSFGNVLAYREYNRPYCTTSDVTNHLLLDFKPDAYGNWLMLSSLVCSGKTVFCLRKLDKYFNEIWVKDFSTSGMHNTPKHLLIESDGYTMTGSINNANAGLGYVNYYASLIIKCDTSGTMLWSWQNAFDIANLQYTINDIIRSKDSGYIYCGSGSGHPIYYTDGSGHWADIVTEGWIEKIDASHNSVWKQTIGTVHGSVSATEQTVLKELPNGDLIVAGTVGKLYDLSDETKAWIRGSLTKLSGTDGHIIWQRLYKSPDMNDTMYLNIYDIQQTNDGGYILAGQAKNAIDRKVGPLQQGWLVKVDSNGCEGGASCNPEAIIPVNPTANYINIYPNPSTSDYELQYEVQNKEPLQLVISDITGRMLLQTNLPAHQNSYHIHAANWATGVYVYQVTQGTKSLYYGKLLKY